MRRIVESVGVGDTGTSLSACLQVSPFNGDEVALLLQGSQKSTQTGNLLELRDSSGNAMLCADCNGVLYPSSLTLDSTAINTGTLNAAVVCGSTLSGEQGTITAIDATLIDSGTINAAMVSGTTLSGAQAYVPTINATTVTGTTGKFGTVQVSTQLSANGTELYTKTQNGVTMTSTRVVGVSATHDANAATAVYIPVTQGKTVMIEARIAAYCSAGAMLASGGGYHLASSVVGSGQADYLTTVMGTNVIPLTAGSDMAAWIPGITKGDNATSVAGLTFTGSADNDIAWAYDLTYVTI